MAGVRAIVAKSVARIFFRNAINLGLPVLLCDTDTISDGDDLELDLESGMITNATTGEQKTCSKIPDIMLRLLEEGGLVPYVKRHGDLPLAR
jgi:3-isopropylmalate/(R)-2-methylmalate dehydratase small subunit